MAFGHHSARGRLPKQRIGPRDGRVTVMEGAREHYLIRSSWEDWDRLVVVVSSEYYLASHLAARTAVRPRTHDDPVQVEREALEVAIGVHDSRKSWTPHRTLHRLMKSGCQSYRDSWSLTQPRSFIFGSRLGHDHRPPHEYSRVRGKGRGRRGRPNRQSDSTAPSAQCLPSEIPDCRRVNSCTITGIHR